MSGSGIFHGGALDRAIAESGGRREEWLDLSTGINPRPYPVDGLDADCWTRLPGSGALDRLVEAARQAYGVPDGMDIVAAPGTQALIETLPRLLPGRTATVIAPAAGTYREHDHCCGKAGRAVRHAASPAMVGDDESLAVVVNPNNPDGHVWERKVLKELAWRLHSSGGVLVVDEAFCDTVQEASIIADGVENVVVLRSFGKFFGLAGLRLGFAVAAPELVQRLNDWFGPWAVSGPAMAIGARALGDRQWIEATSQRLERDSLSLAEMLSRKGFDIAGRNGLFVLARHRQAADIARSLAKARILVRPFPDRPGLLRFGLCADAAERGRLEEALSRVIGALA